MSDFRIKIQAELDAKKFTSQLDSLKKNTVKVPVELDLKNTDLQKALSGLTKALKMKVDYDPTGLNKANQQAKQLQAQLSRFEFKVNTKGIDSELSKLESQIARFKQQSMSDNQRMQIDKITASYQNLKQVVSEVSDKTKSGTLDASDIDKYNRALKTTQNQVKILSNELSGIASIDDRMQFSNRIETWLNNNTKATEEAKAHLKEYIDLLRDAGTEMTSGQLNDLKKGFSTWTSQMQAAGRTGKSSWEELKRATSQIFEFAGVYGMIQNVAFEIPRQMISSVMDVDDALTNLQMATGVTNDRAKELMATYAQLGDQLKATSTDVATAATEYMKQGQTIADSNKLAQDSIILSKIGGLSSDDATRTITAAMKSYDLGVDEVMDFVDQISAVDLVSATDVSGLAQAFNEVAANARQAGVSTQELLSYAAAIGETTQEGMASVGTSLNAIFSRMGNIKLSRLKDYETGEDLSNVETVLRGVGIQLRDTQDEFRDFDEVLDETAGRWNSFSGVQQRAVAQAFAGTNHMNEFMVLMQQWSNVEKYIAEADNASGQSMEKYEAYTDSLAGKIEGFTNSFQTLSTTVMSSDVFGFLIDSGTTLINVLTDILDVGNGIPALFATIGGISLFKNLDKLKNHRVSTIMNNKFLILT